MPRSAMRLWFQPRRWLGRTGRTSTQPLGGHGERYGLEPHARQPCESAHCPLLGVHVRVGNEDNLWDASKQRWESVRQVEWVVKLCRRFGRKVATADEARKMMKIGVWYNSVLDQFSVSCLFSRRICLVSSPDPG